MRHYAENRREISPNNRRFVIPSMFGGGQSAGHYGDPARTDRLFTTFNGSTNIAALADSIGRVEPLVGGVNLIQPVSASRLAWAGFTRGGVVQTLNYPQAVSNAAWTKTNCTPLDGQTSWDGSATATRLAVGTATNSGISQAPFSYSVTAIIAAKIKKGTAEWTRLFVPSAANNSIWFDLTNRVVGTVGSGVTTYGMTDAGNGYDLIWASGTGTNNGGIRIEDTNGGLGSPTAGQTIFIADPIFALGTAVPAFQNRLGPSDITQSGLPTVYAYCADGVDDYLYVDAASWGTATQGCYAAAGNNWTIGAMYCGHDDAGVLYSQCGAVDANKMLEVSLSSGVPQSRIRGTNTASSAAINDGRPHLALTTCTDGVITTSIDGVDTTPTVGAAAAETEKVAFMARTPSSPAGHLMGRCDPFLIDRALSAADRAYLWSFVRNRYGAA
jgi:hypothetical protein